MIELTCCSSSKWGTDITDLGHEDSCDFLLGQCSNCGAYWVNVFCEASGITGYEPVSNDDARIMLATPPGPELMAFMNAWSREHI